MNDDQQSYRGWTLETYRARDEKGDDVGPWFCVFWYSGQSDRGEGKSRNRKRKIAVEKAKNSIDKIENSINKLRKN